ncbi:MAG: tetratricopeptide repeat-containing protein, partial [Gammaproteobacteria bacterium]
FSDIKGFSGISETEYREFIETIWPTTTQAFTRFKASHKEVEDLLVFNAWGDALIVVFEDPIWVNAIFDYRDAFLKIESDSHKLRTLRPRIACHFGEFRVFDDPVTQGKNVIGANINLAARLEPVTRPGFVFVSQDFKSQFEKSSHAESGYQFDDIGELILPKGFGSKEAFVMRRNGEEKHVLERLLKVDLIKALPDAEPISDPEKARIESLRALPKDFLPDALAKEAATASTPMKRGLATLCKQSGQYDLALSLIEDLHAFEKHADGLAVHPYQDDVRLLKDQANSLTRTGRYQEALQIVYSLWQRGLRDGDTLSMLAAQYKRRAFVDANGEPREEPERELLERAFDLYLEALRIDLGNYYPAINAAYLGIMLNTESNAGKGRKLAQYLLNTWSDSPDKDWWLSSTLAECELLMGDAETAREKMEKAINDTHPDSFDLQSTRQQIELFSRMTPCDGCDALIELLNQHISE